MKKCVLPIALFLLAFLITYFTLSFLLPGFRIKLEAPPAEYCFASLRHAHLFKALLSTLLGALAAALPRFLSRSSR